MSNEIKTQVVVLGSGPAGYSAAFRAAALLGVNTKVTCILGMTDNAVNSHATMPSSIKYLDKHKHKLLFEN